MEEWAVHILSVGNYGLYFRDSNTRRATNIFGNTVYTLDTTGFPCDEPWAKVIVHSLTSPLNVLA